MKDTAVSSPGIPIPLKANRAMLGPSGKLRIKMFRYFHTGTHILSPIKKLKTPRKTRDAGFMILINLLRLKPWIGGTSTPTSWFQKLRSSKASITNGKWPSCENITPPGSKQGKRNLRHVLVDEAKSTSIYAQATGSENRA